jgi:hypothetical protein
LMTQKPKVTAGTLVNACLEPSSGNKFPASREVGGNWGLAFDRTTTHQSSDREIHQ